MTDKLEIFITEHLQEFDTLKAPKELWGDISLQLTPKKSYWIKSKWFSKFKFFGFGTMILLTIIYFVLHTSEQKYASVSQNNTTSKFKKETETQINYQNNNTENKNIESKTNSQSVNFAKEIKDQDQIFESSENSAIENKKENMTSLPQQDSTVSSKLNNGMFAENTNSNEGEAKSFTAIPYAKEKKDEQEDEIDNSTKTKKGFNLFKGKKAKKNNAAEETIRDSEFSCILYKTTPCSVMSSFTFPGKGHMDGTIKSEGCNNLPNNIRSVWIHGTTLEKLVLPISNGFKNIKLVKSDGRILNPIAISHFNNQSGIITYYSGKYFNLAFDDKVEIILFFYDAQVGDKILFDKTIEVTIKK